MDPSPAPPRAARIAYLSYSSAEFDARTQRMAASAAAAGHEVVVYARWDPRLPLEETVDDYRIVRVAADWLLAVPGLRARGRRRVAAKLARAARAGTAAGGTAAVGAAATGRRRGLVDRVPARFRGTRFAFIPRAVKWLLNPFPRWRHLLLLFPVRPLGWATALVEATEPADLWHGMWAGSLPALARLADRHGGATIYDSRDVYLHAREFDRLNPVARRLFLALERRWARRVDRVITVNEAYAEILERTLGVARPPVVMNCPPRWTPPSPRPDRLRERLGLPAGTGIVLYQGNLLTERGIEQSMDAILEVPGAVLVLMGMGSAAARYRALGEQEPYHERVRFLPPVPPRELLEWTASADVLVMAIQPTTLNHRFTTPQKLFEALAAGVPVVASDLPGMADIVRATGAGVLCDPTSPASIATALRSVLEASPEERAAFRDRALAAAHATYNWEAQLTTLHGVYRELLGPERAPGLSPAAP